MAFLRFAKDANAFNALIQLVPQVLLNKTSAIIIIINQKVLICLSSLTA
jgi:hypothetical protein